MTHRLSQPFLTDDPTDINGRGGVMVTRIAQERPGVLHLQGRRVGSRAAPLSWRMKPFDVCEMIYVYRRGYGGGVLRLHGPQDQLFTELAAKIAKEEARDAARLGA